MPLIEIETHILADIQICFDLARSIDLHSISTAQTKEKAIAGCTTGLIGYGETVTWQARHLGIQQKLTSKITAFNCPFHFRDEQLKGVFRFIKHDHTFSTENGLVIMKDSFHFASPYGIAGKLFDIFFLKGYMKNFLLKRNAVIKEYAETGKWKILLH